MSRKNVNMSNKHKPISPKKKLENSIKKAKASLLALKALIDMLEEGLVHKNDEQLYFDFADENGLKKAREEMTSAIDIYIREAMDAYKALSSNNRNQNPFKPRNDNNSKAQQQLRLQI